jgi:WD40 repeat protein
MKKFLVGLMCTLASGWTLCQPALSQTDAVNSNEDHGRNSRVVPIGAIGVPGTSTANPFVNFDQARVAPQLQLLFVSSRSSKAVAIIDALTDRQVGETPAVFAGVGIDSPHSGPDGNVVAGRYLFAGDYPSTVRVFDLGASLTAPPQVTTIDTGGAYRADEMDYDPADNVVVVSNGDSTPAFITLISTTTLKIVKQVTFDGTNGTPDTSQGGIGSVLYDSLTNKFLVSIPEVGSDLTAGAVAVVDPVTAQVTQVFSGLNNCMPSGMAQGPGENVLVTCDPGFPAPDPVQFAPRTYVINGRTGAILANLTEVGGVDYGAYNPTDHHYYLGARDYFTSPTATTASPVLGVIDADTNQWIENFPTGTDAHSVSVNPLNNQIFVPIENPNSLCGTLPGCVSVFTDVPRGLGW